jgi:hypothetical protein
VQPIPTCSAATCSDPAVVHWQRRLTPDEITQEQAREQDRRDRLIALADPQLPPPDFGPMPDCLTYTHTVYGCMRHAITRDAAALIHQAECTAPKPGDLPGCDCTPEPAPQPDPDPPAPQLPPGW